MKNKKYDFSGWATKNDIRCSDGRVIKKDAFVGQDGMTVPLLYNHDHSDPTNVLGHALLENRDEGVYMYGTFNESPKAQHSKEAVKHSDLFALSIYANQLVEKGADVVHGMIREVSLVLAGANPGAVIEPVLEHNMDGEDSAYITFSGLNELTMACEAEEPELSHADDEKKEEKKDEPEKKERRKIVDILADMTDEQQAAVVELLNEVGGGSAEDDTDDDDEEDEEEETVKHNVFDNEARTRKGGVICHADQMDILERAKDSRIGTFKNALKTYAEENALQHTESASPVGGFVDTVSPPDTSFTDVLPEYKDVRSGAPELITNDQGWISVVMSKTHKSPISRVRTGQVDIRNAEQLRAKGYQKGSKKTVTGNIKLARRTTDPQTVYVKNALHRDDIIDITDFDYVQYLYNIDRMCLNEEVAMAVMLGDGRGDADPDRIFPEHIRPIWLDDELYTMHVDLDRSNIQGSNTSGYFGENYIEAEAMINSCLYAREQYKGTGTPDMFITPHQLNVMLLARDRNGRRIYSSKNELAAAFNVNNIYTAEQFADKTRTVTIDGTEHTKKLIALIVNLADYTLGSTKGGEVTHFTQFDIDFNQQKSLLETRLSGALTRIQAAIAIEDEVVASNEDDHT